MTDGIVICGFQYPFNPDRTKFPIVFIVFYMLFNSHSTCCSFCMLRTEEYMCDSCLLGDWKKCITTHGISFGFFFAVCFYEFKIQDITVYKPAPYRLYSHMTPQTQKSWREWGSLGFKHVYRQILILHHFLTWTMMSLPMWGIVWFYCPKIGCYTSFSQGSWYFCASNNRLLF